MTFTQRNDTVKSLGPQAAAAFKGAKKSDVEEVLDSLAALGILAAYDARGTRRWKSTRAAA